MLYIGLYVDKIILAGRTEKQLQEIKGYLSKKFDIKDLGEMKYFLGMKVIQRKENKFCGLGNQPILKTS